MLAIANTLAVLNGKSYSETMKALRIEFPFTRYNARRKTVRYVLKRSTIRPV